MTAVPFPLAQAGGGQMSYPTWTPSAAGASADALELWPLDVPPDSPPLPAAVAATQPPIAATASASPGMDPEKAEDLRTMNDSIAGASRYCRSRRSRGQCDVADQSAWERFHGASLRSIRRFGARCGIPPSHREDFAQDVCLELLASALEQFDPRRACFATWLYAIVAHRAADLVARLRRRRTLRLDLQAADLVPGPADLEPLTLLLCRDQVNSALRLLRPRVSRRTYEALYRLAVRQDSWEETSAALGLTREQLSDRYRFALGKLREILDSGDADRPDRGGGTVPKHATANILQNSGISVPESTGSNE